MRCRPWHTIRSHTICSDKSRRVARSGCLEFHFFLNEDQKFESGRNGSLVVTGGPIKLSSCLAALTAGPKVIVIGPCSTPHAFLRD
jgi:hypothetical protein